jgi:hypothetical protein
MTCNKDTLQVKKITLARGVIGEVWCGFLRIYAPTPYSAVFLLYASAPAPMKIGFGAVRFCVVRWRCSLAV